MQAANTAIRHDMRLGDCYDRVKARHGGNHGIAVSHVATKMIIIMWHMLKHHDAVLGKKRWIVPGSIEIINFSSFCRLDQIT